MKFSTLFVALLFPAFAQAQTGNETGASLAAATQQPSVKDNVKSSRTAKDEDLMRLAKNGYNPAGGASKLSNQPRKGAKKRK